ncbi:MAG: hypothetical protein ACYTG2_18595 [Planctomycetota bacterium]
MGGRRASTPSPARPRWHTFPIDDAVLSQRFTIDRVCVDEWSGPQRPGDPTGSWSAPSRPVDGLLQSQ